MFFINFDSSKIYKYLNIICILCRNAVFYLFFLHKFILKDMFYFSALKLLATFHFRCLYINYCDMPYINVLMLHTLVIYVLYASCF